LSPCQFQNHLFHQKCKIFLKGIAAQNGRKRWNPTPTGGSTFETSEDPKAGFIGSAENKPHNDNLSL
jgi:hypothetical protein